MKLVVINTKTKKKQWQFFAEMGLCKADCSGNKSRRRRLREYEMKKNMKTTY